MIPGNDGDNLDFGGWNLGQFPIFWENLNDSGSPRSPYPADLCRNSDMDGSLKKIFLFHLIPAELSYFFPQKNQKIDNFYTTSAPSGSKIDGILANST